MAFVARKIARAKWDDAEGKELVDFPSDAVTSDLRTQRNSLSFWKCGDANLEDLRRAVLAVATGGKNVERFDVAWIPVSELKAVDVPLAETTGNTPVACLRDQHIDASELTYGRIGRLATLVRDSIFANRFRRFTKKEVKQIIADAVSRKEIAMDDLSVGIQSAMEK